MNKDSCNMLKVVFLRHNRLYDPQHEGRSVSRGLFWRSCWVKDMQSGLSPAAVEVDRSLVPRKHRHPEVSLSRPHWPSADHRLWFWWTPQMAVQSSTAHQPAELPCIEHRESKTQTEHGWTRHMELSGWGRHLPE